MDRRRIAELFEQTIEVSPADRVSWLAAACADDQALRVEIERMLRLEAKVSAFMETPPAFVVASQSLATALAETPREFGAWRVLRLIGSGGMGEVWLAERSDGEFEQRGAVKQLAYPTPGLLQRFRQERQILAHLEHPNIARLIDGGVDAAGAPYLVMEFVEGVPITDFARDRALDMVACLRLFLRVCEAVQYAHQNLVVHRDLKPSNIFVTVDGAPKLLDFGIAKVLDATDTAAATQTLARVLTPEYAAPEQFDGGAITTATDVYALGVVLYELLAGVRPRRLAGLDHVVVQQPAEPPAPSTALDRGSGLARRRAMRGDLDRIALTALAADPKRRYPSAEALAADLRCYLEGRPISARRASALYRLRKFSRRNRFGLAAAIAVLAVSVVATAISLNQAQRALAQAARAEQQTARAEAVRAFLVGVFQHADPDENKGQPITAQQLLGRGERQLHTIGDGQPAIRTDLTTLLSGLYWDIGDSAHAASLLPLLETGAADERIPDSIRERALSQLARIENDQRRFDPAIAHARKALALAEGANASDTHEASEARHFLAYAMVEQGDPGAEPLLREDLAGDLAAHGEHSDEVIGDLLLLGASLDGLSRREEAVAALMRQVTLARDMHGELHSSVVNGLNALAGVLLRKGDWAAAASTYRQALDAERRLLGPDHASTLIIESNLVAVVEREGQFTDALRERLEMLRVMKQTPDGVRNDSVALVTHLIGFDYRELGKLAEAEAAARDALALWRQGDGAIDAIDLAPPLENLGVTLYLEGRYGEAETMQRQAIAIMRKRAAPSSQWLARMRGELADTLRREHRYAEALQESSDATAILAAAVKSSSDANPVLGVLMAQLSEAQLDAGDAASAELVATEALAISRRALPSGNYRLGIPLFALARANLALGRPDSAELLLRESLAVRSPPHPANDPRVLEVAVALVKALTTQGKNGEARKLSVEVEPRLKASKPPHVEKFRAHPSAH